MYHQQPLLIWNDLGYGHVFSAAPEPEGIVCGSQLQRVTAGFGGFILDFGVARMSFHRDDLDAAPTIAAKRAASFGAAAF